MKITATILVLVVTTTSSSAARESTIRLGRDLKNKPNDRRERELARGGVKGKPDGTGNGLGPGKKEFSCEKIYEEGPTECNAIVTAGRRGDETCTLCCEESISSDAGTSITETCVQSSECLTPC
mmetsp:Transcript_5179/g.14666  ORF Transcript_5179/g.14666 Transcript_5179/m.14666 type:complete len:124 (+) Transcript_5179:116-487(+)|eukprot:CAMPEP_0181025056 /NCGR_PEP_ID=MMETSP1070-20121207/2901_1 /TAXON_ID=265543 /ORGANISM="Minutocellus polymorphus, Strain NH13" /LENGTH=123 /DNA_ID=CAMNT_0023102153 /DNA_START=75 /DNA_END=446 /DNA_ORIENTATION=+